MTEQAGPQIPQDAMQPPAVPVPGVEGVNPAEVQVTPERIEGSRSLNLADLEPLTDPREFNEQTGLLASLMAKVQVGSSAVGIIDRSAFLGSRDEPISTDIIWMGKASEGGNSQILRTKNPIYAVAMKPDGGIYLDEKGRPKLFGLKSGRSLSIGRDQDNDITLDDGFVSSRHADLAYDEETNQITITDRNSTNGTFIETKPKEKGEAAGDETLQAPDEETRPNQSNGGWWDGAVYAAKTEVSELLPEPPRSVEDTDYMGELPPPYNSDAAGEQAPQDPTAYFDSPQKLRDALKDPDMDPKIRAELRGVVVAWQELQHSELARSLWEETIKPRLGSLAELNLAEQSQEVTKLTQEVEHQSEGWRMLTNRLYDGSPLDDLMQVVRQYDLGTEAIERVDRQYHTLVQNDGTLRAVHALGLDTEDADMKVRQLANKIDGFTIEDEDIEAFVEQVKEMDVENRSLSEITEELRGKVAFEGWRTLVFNVEELVQQVGRGQGVFANPALENGFRLLKQCAYDFSDGIRPGHIELNPELTQELFRVSSQLALELNGAKRFTALSQDEATWLSGQR